MRGTASLRPSAAESSGQAVLVYRGCWSDPGSLGTHRAKVSEKAEKTSNKSKCARDTKHVITGRDT